MSLPPVTRGPREARRRDLGPVGVDLGLPSGCAAAPSWTAVWWCGCTLRCGAREAARPIAIRPGELGVQVYALL